MSNQVVNNPNIQLANNVQTMFQKKIIVLMDASRQRVFDGDNSKTGNSFFYLPEHQVKRLARRQMNLIAKKSSRGNFAVGASLALKGHQPLAQVWHITLSGNS